MALVLADRVKDTTTTTGTGAVTLSNVAPTGFRTFGAAVGNGNTTYYTIAGQGSSEWEVGIGTYTAAGTSLSRDTVLASSNANAPVNFSAGTKDVFVTYPAGKAIADGYGTLPVANGGTGATSLTSGYLLKGNGTSAVSTSVVYESGGKVGIGTTTPAEALDVKGTILSGIDIGAYVKVGRFNSTFGGSAISTAGNATFLSLQAEGVEGLQIAAGTGTLLSIPTYNNTATGSFVVITSTGAIRRSSSSVKYKKDIENLSIDLVTNAINKLRPVWYRTKNAEGDDKAEWSHIGLIAEEVHEVEPRLVRYRTAEVLTDEEGNRTERELEVPEPEDVDYARLSVLLLAEIKQLRARVAALEAK